MELSQDNIAHLVVRYATKITPLSVSPKKQDQVARRVFEVLSDRDPDLFNQQLTPTAQQVPTGAAFCAIARNIYLPHGAQLGMLSFTLEQSGMQLYLPRRLMAAPSIALEPERDDLWSASYDKRAVDTLWCVSQALAEEGLQVQFRRMGKIYEVVFGPFDTNVFGQVASKLLRYSYSDYSELSLRVAPREKDHHFRLEVNVGGPTDPRQVTAVLDINNVDMSKSLDPTQMEREYRFASSQMPQKLFELLEPFARD